MRVIWVGSRKGGLIGIKAPLPDKPIIVIMYIPEHIEWEMKSGGYLQQFLHIIVRNIPLLDGMT